MATSSWPRWTNERRRGSTSCAPRRRPVIIWINGAFGVGKTTVSTLLADRLPAARLADPEHVGYLLASNLKDVPVDDFQKYPPWRRLVPHMLNEIVRFTGADVVAPQSVVVEDYWRELNRGMSDLGLAVFHVVLDADRAVLIDRIEADEVERGARDWRFDHIDPFLEARPWLCPAADLVVDTSHSDPADIVGEIIDRLPPSSAG